MTAGNGKMYSPLEVKPPKNIPRPTPTSIETYDDPSTSLAIENGALTPDTIFPARQLQKSLAGQGVDPVLIKRIIERMHFAREGNGGANGASMESRGTYGRFLKVVEGFLPPPSKEKISPNIPRTVALIGPTGVGKTTTVAKIASRLALEEDRRVALVTLDTYRIAAAEQLKTYARLLGVPLAIVNEPQELDLSLEKFSDFDDILIDTPGYSPKDTKALRQLADTFQANSQIDIHLLITCSTRGEEMRRIMDRFEPIGFDQLIFSKMDEATIWGDLLNIWIMGGYDVSYFTTGQRVPEDLEKASIGRLCEKLLTAVEG